ncbi:MAG: hypothetical protein Q7V05_12440 [Methanoregula sp.]|nr:hypothetical protein [Methanoregula sp.]
MDKNALVILLVCIAAVFLAGCTQNTPPPAVPVTTTLPPATVTTVPVDAQTCTTDADCVPAQCCHPASCVRQSAKPVCTDVICTMSCEGPLDCGAGTCGCTNSRCSVIQARPTTLSVVTKTSVTLTASPQRYSPMISFPPGVGITVDANGFDAARSRFAWNATHGNFFSWGPVNYTVDEVGNPVTNHGEKLYWSFTQKPASILEPVVITVTATDAATGRMQGSSNVVLLWDGDNAVMLKDTR